MDADAAVYALNLALLATHQVDSAYWKEWDLFRLPGGIQLNLALNFVLLALALGGFALVLQGHPTGQVSALVLAVAGIAAFAIHTAFMLSGDVRFRLPASVAVLAATLLVSLVQARLSLAHLWA